MAHRTRRTPAAPASSQANSQLYHAGKEVQVKSAAPRAAPVGGPRRARPLTTLRAGHRMASNPPSVTDSTGATSSNCFGPWGPPGRSCPQCLGCTCGARLHSHAPSPPAFHACRAGLAGRHTTACGANGRALLLLRLVFQRVARNALKGAVHVDVVLCGRFKVRDAALCHAPLLRLFLRYLRAGALA